MIKKGKEKERFSLDLRRTTNNLFMFLFLDLVYIFTFYWNTLM